MTIVKCETFYERQAIAPVPALGRAASSRMSSTQMQSVGEKILSLPLGKDVKSFLINQGLDPAPGTPEQFGAYIKSEMTKWAKVVKESGAKAN